MLPKSLEGIYGLVWWVHRLPTWSTAKDINKMHFALAATAKKPMFRAFELKIVFFHPIDVANSFVRYFLSSLIPGSLPYMVYIPSCQQSAFCQFGLQPNRSAMQKHEILGKKINFHGRIDVTHFSPIPIGKSLICGYVDTLAGNTWLQHNCLPRGGAPAKTVKNATWASAGARNSSSIVKQRLYYFSLATQAKAWYHDHHSRMVRTTRFQLASLFRWVGRNSKKNLNAMFGQLTCNLLYVSRLILTRPIEWDHFQEHPKSSHPFFGRSATVFWRFSWYSRLCTASV